MKWLWNWRQRPTLKILDDFFPNLLTGFRVAEYNAIFSAFPRAQVLSAYPHYASCIVEYARVHPEYARRVNIFEPRALDDCGLAYVNFLNNAVLFLDALESKAIPFVITLYPGGGFGLNETESDYKLDRVLKSPLLKAIIVTQRVTRDYVIARNRRSIPIHFVPGVVVNPSYFFPSVCRRKSENNVFHVCFVAEKYMEKGVNKGYPIFIEAAKSLALERENIHFHVVGNFDSSDVMVTDIANRIRFHGRLMTSELKGFFSRMDVIVSPNQPFLLHPGNFDGFPTGCCVEASLCGVTVVATDELKQNPGYRDGEDMLIVPPKSSVIADTLRNLVDHPDHCFSLGVRGQAMSRMFYAPSRQIGPRLNILKDMAKRHGVAL